MVKKKFKKLNEKVKGHKRLIYSFLAIFILIFLAIGVYSISNFSNPIHSTTQIASFTDCGEKFIQWDGNAWVCGSLIGSLWNIIPEGISYLAGDMYITKPSSKIVLKHSNGKCYACGPQNDFSFTCQETSCFGEGCDNDLDGYAAFSCGGSDCNDNDGGVYPGSLLSYRGSSSGVDVNCDGVSEIFWSTTSTNGYDISASSVGQGVAACKFINSEICSSSYLISLSTPSSCSDSSTKIPCIWGTPPLYKESLCVSDTGSSSAIYARCK